MYCILNLEFVFLLGEYQYSPHSPTRYIHPEGMVYTGSKSSPFLIQLTISYSRLVQGCCRSGIDDSPAIAGLIVDLVIIG